MIKKLKEDIRKFANQEKAKVYQRFFKTGKGEYAYGDKFLGLTVPQSRKLAIKYRDLAFDDVKKLLQSKIHEERLIAVLILVNNFNKGSKTDRKNIFDYYLKNTKYINNWDLVDLSAYKIVGQYFLESRHSGDPDLSGDSRISFFRGGERFWTSQSDVLTRLAKSENLWERRIAIIATYQFIKKKKEHEWTFRIAKILLKDKHDLIHKAVGWMLREVGKQCSQEVLENFLKEHHKQIPRTTLRYAIERFPEKLRKGYLL